MKTKKRVYAMLITSALFMGMTAMTSLAASKKITSIRLECKDEIVRGGAVEEDNVTFETTASDYTITGWEFISDSIVWEDTETPRVEVRLETGDDFSFSVAKDKIKVKGDLATVYKTERESSQVLIITFNLAPMANRIGAVEYAYLNDRVASWSPASGADAYDIYLFRDDKVLGSKKTTKETTYDFGTAMLKEGAYYYRVRGVSADGTKQGPYLDSEEIYRDANGTGTASETQKTNNSGIVAGTWQLDATGWWWKRKDSTWPVNQWEQINNKWYLFNGSGYMITGWVNWNEQWYFLGPDGDMWVDCKTPDGFTVNADGVRVGV